MYSEPNRQSQMFIFQVMMTDELPLFVCQKCFYFLNISYKLIVNSLKADTLLRSKLKEPSLPSTDDNHFGKPERTIIVQMPIDANASSVSNRSIEEFNLDTGVAIKCDICDKIFEDLNVFDTHVEQEHLSAWACNLCDNSYEESRDLLAHKETSHSGQIVTCRECSGRRDSNDSTQTESVSAEIVERTQTVKVAKEQSANSTEVICRICKLTIENPKLLAKHDDIHTTKLARCRTCQTRCHSVYDLFLHKKAAHNMYRRVNLKFVCDMCDKFFSNTSQWQHHMEKSCPRKFSVYTCKYCKSSFSTNHKLTFHLRVSPFATRKKKRRNQTVKLTETFFFSET